jgi:hypothetical protein
VAPDEGGLMSPAGQSTGLELLLEAAATLEAVAGACEDEVDRLRLSELARRVRDYLATSRPTTPLGMPLIRSQPHRLTQDQVVRATSRSHIRIVGDE